MQCVMRSDLQLDSNKKREANLGASLSLFACI